jgi:predicted ribosome quality control (RQC) complex YloA/Tae2 family protein
MSFGPEYVYGLQAALNEALPWRVSRVEGGESWVALRVDAEKSREAPQAQKPLEPWLLLSWGSGGAGCCLADTPSVDFLKRSAPARTPLAEALKSRFTRGRILSARQINRDRVLEFEASRLVAAGFEVRYFLVLEATEPVGNLVLLDEERRIEELARLASPDVNLYRTLLPGHLYAPPPAFKGLSLSETDELEFESLSRFEGIGRPLARMIENRWEERPPREWLAALKSL